MPAKKPGGYAAALKFRSKLLVLPQLDANNIEEWDLVANNGFYSAGWLKMWEASNTEGAKDADATAQKTGKVRGVSSRSPSVHSEQKRLTWANLLIDLFQFDFAHWQIVKIGHSRYLQAT